MDGMIEQHSTCQKSPCGGHRRWLTRFLSRTRHLKVIVFIGVNPSKADRETPDQTDKKWRVFGSLNGATHVVYVNLFTRINTEVSGLATCHPSDLNEKHADDWLHHAFSMADIIVPCWGSRKKIPKSLHGRIDQVLGLIKQYPKVPVKVFGTTKSGDPMHPLMLSYDTKLKPWSIP